MSDLCANCHAQPAREGFRYCSRTCGKAAQHRLEALEALEPPPPPPSMLMDDPPAYQPQYSDNLFEDPASQWGAPGPSSLTQSQPTLWGDQPGSFENSGLGRYDEELDDEEEGAGFRQNAGGGGFSGFDAYDDHPRGTTNGEADRVVGLFEAMGVDDGMCTQCGVRPKFGTFQYCGRTCGRNARNGLPPARPPQTSSRISLPQRRFSDETGSEFGVSNDLTTQGSPAPGTGRRGFWSTVRRVTGSDDDLPALPGGAMCKIPRCGRTEANIGSRYCSDAHRKKGVDLGLDPACLMCRQMPRTNNKSLFCSRNCSDRAMRGAPMLLEVPAKDPRFTDVSHQFTTAWKHTPNPPRVARVYKVILPQSSLTAYETYKARVETTGQFVSKGQAAGNERRRWHGTKRQCKIGDDPKNLTPCRNTGCNLCCILKASYDVKLSNVGMFGKGIYTSATSSKSDTYTKGSSSGSAYKAMFLNRVVVGRGRILKNADNTLRTAPDGYNSVIANPGQGLNYDELIVYDNDAIRVSWLILYG